MQSRVFSSFLFGSVFQIKQKQMLSTSYYKKYVQNMTWRHVSKKFQKLISGISVPITVLILEEIERNDKTFSEGYRAEHFTACFWFQKPWKTFACARVLIFRRSSESFAQNPVIKSRSNLPLLQEEGWLSLRHSRSFQATFLIVHAITYRRSFARGLYHRICSNASFLTVLC